MNKDNDSNIVKKSAMDFWVHIIVKVILGTFAFQYVLWAIFQKDIPWYIDILAGTYFSRIVWPIMIVALVLRYCDFSIPLLESVRYSLGY